MGTEDTPLPGAFWDRAYPHTVTRVGPLSPPRGTPLLDSREKEGSSGEDRQPEPTADFPEQKQPQPTLLPSHWAGLCGQTPGRKCHSRWHRAGQGGPLGMHVHGDRGDRRLPISFPLNVCRNSPAQPQSSPQGAHPRRPPPGRVWTSPGMRLW